MLGAFIFAGRVHFCCEGLFLLDEFIFAGRVQFCVVLILAGLVWCTYSGAAPLEAITRRTLLDDRFKDFENLFSFC